MPKLVKISIKVPCSFCVGTAIIQIEGTNTRFCNKHYRELYKEIQKRGDELYML